MRDNKSPLDVEGIDSGITRSEVLNSVTEGRGKFMYPRIISVTPLADNRLRVGFADGVTKIYDCSSLLQRDMFYPLTDEILFRSVRVAIGGWGLEWTDEIDLAESEVYTNGVEVKGDGTPDL